MNERPLIMALREVRGIKYRNKWRVEASGATV